MEPVPSKPNHIWLPQKLKKRLPTILVTLGSLMIANVAWPILSYQLFISPSLQQSELITPVNLEQTAFFNQNDTPPNPAAAIAAAPEILGQELDYTKASNWFPSQSFGQSQNESKITHYNVTIPKLDVDSGVVAIGGEDLSENLIQYPGTANPGQLGSPVIFGHSVLRQFYNPSIDNPNRYISIFSKIMTLEDGDEILVDFDGIQYKYVVKDKFEVKPTDVYILQQRYNNRELKLVTCVPEGTYLRRGVIVAQLQDIGHDRQLSLAN